METEASPAAHPAFLPPGTLVGPWRVVDWGGRGVYGAVYRAVLVEHEEAEPTKSVALKLALFPRDPRFPREVEMLSRLDHPSIPRLRDHGEWQRPSGTVHPFIVMDWVDGTPLYEWARQHSLTSQQVSRLLAQLASALQAVHTLGAVHRDVKGDNVMVRRADGRAILTDLGTSFPPDAALLTPEGLLPGTPAYYSPEAVLFPRLAGREASTCYSARPTDDLYALGVTAYRLVTGKYPTLGEHFKDEAGTWQAGALGSPPPHALNSRVDPRLSALILRMLSVRPEERGTAEQLAEAFEQAAQHPTAESTRPIFNRKASPASVDLAARADEQVPASVDLSRERSLANLNRQREYEWHGRSLITMAATGLTLVAWAWWAAPGRPAEHLSIVQKQDGSLGQKDEGSTALGDAASTASSEDSPALSTHEGMAEDTFPEPVPGQTQPDAKGRCPHKRQVVLNGGCWAPLRVERDECEAANGQMFKDRCYVPVLLPGRAPTSSPSRKP